MHVSEKKSVVSFGLCKCGCGEKTNICKQTRGESIKGLPFRFIMGHYSKTVSMNKEHNPSWKGGRYILDSGYVMVHDPTHARAMSNGYVREHIIIAEKALGRSLPEGVQVHHYGDVGDNSKLVICENQEYHRLLHVRKKSLKECGDASKRKCKYCQKYDDVENLHCVQIKIGKKGWNTYHLSCARVYDRKRRGSNKIDIK